MLPYIDKKIVLYVKDLRFHNQFMFGMRLLDGTDPSTNSLLDVTVPSTNYLLDGTVPSTNSLLDGTLLKCH